MPVPEPECYSHIESEMYQLLMQMNQKLDKLAVTLRNTNSVLEKWQQTKPQEPGPVFDSSAVPKESKYSEAQQVPQENSKKGSSAQSAGSIATGGVPDTPHGQEEPVMLTTPQGVTIVRF